MPTSKPPLYKRNWFIILLLIVVAPVGIVLAWTSNWKKWQKIVATIIGVIFIFIGIAALSPSDDKKAATDTNTKQSTSSSSSAKEETVTLTQSAAENYCQDANLLQNYIDIKTTSIVQATDYNPWFGDSGSTASNGDKIYTLQWSGKNKDTDAKVGFVCDISGTDKNITLHNLAIDGKSVYGPKDEN